MKKFLVLAISLIALASCEKDPDMSQLDIDFTVYTDYDSSTDFSNFTTYCLPDSILVPGDGMKNSYWKDESAQRLISAAAEAMDSLGYKRVTNPDEAPLGLQLSFTQMRTHVTGFVGGGMYGSWWDFAFWGPYWGGWYYPYPISYSYDTGTLMMEMVDLTKRTAATDDEKQDLTVVWHAYADGLLYGSSRINLQLALRALNQAFTQSPYLNILYTNE